MASKSRKRPARPAPKRPEEFSEQCLQFHTKQWLDKSGIWNRLLIFHVANERKGGFGAQMHFKRMGVRAGVADWLAFPPGRPAWAIELKDEDGDDPRSTQNKFRDAWEAAGHVYVVVRKLEDFQRIVSGLVLF